MADGCRLLVRRYGAIASSRAAETERRTMLLVHGACQHGGRFDQAAKFFALGGWDVLVPDLRGHGLSQGERTHVRDFTQYVHDLSTVQREFHCDGRRTVLLGHSMGGLVAIRFAQLLPQRLAAAALLSPLLAIKQRVAAWKIALGRLACKVAPRLRFNAQIRAEQTSKCPKVLAEKKLDKLLQQSVTGTWFLALQNALSHAWKEAAKLRSPLLLMQAEQDAVVEAAAARPWLQSVGAADKTLEFIPHAFHELLSEPRWPALAAEIHRWLDKRVQISSSSAPRQGLFSCSRPMQLTG
jgi:lysophospholipase